MLILAIEVVNLVIFFSMDSDGFVHQAEQQSRDDSLQAEYDIKLINTILNSTAITACIIGFFHIRRYKIYVIKILVNPFTYPASTYNPTHGLKFSTIGQYANTPAAYNKTEQSYLVFIGWSLHHAAAVF